MTRSSNAEQQIMLGVPFVMFYFDAAARARNSVITFRVTRERYAPNAEV